MLLTNQTPALQSSDFVITCMICPITVINQRYYKITNLIGYQLD